jgi:hypothetical protein
MWLNGEPAVFSVLLIEATSRTIDGAVLPGADRESLLVYPK